MMALLDTGAARETAPSGPRAEDALTFGADTLLLGSLVVAVGLPLYFESGLSEQPFDLLWLLISAGLLPMLTPIGVWLVRWGLPVRIDGTRVALRVLLYALPALVVVTAAVQAGYRLAMLGIGVMTFVGAVLIAVVTTRTSGAVLRPRLLALRVASAIGTPVIILGIAQVAPFGLEAIGGWAIPMPVAASGAIGAARGFLLEFGEAAD